MDCNRYVECINKLLELGFDLDKNSARDLLDALKDCYVNFDEYFNCSVN